MSEASEWTLDHGPWPSVGERAMQADDIWALLRHDFSHRNETIKAVIPWGGEQAVIVTDGAVYLAVYDGLVGYSISERLRR